MFFCLDPTVSAFLDFSLPLLSFQLFAFVVGMFGYGFLCVRFIFQPGLNMLSDVFADILPYV